MDLSLCGAAPAGIRGDEDLFDWVSLQGEKEKRRRPRLSSNSIPSPMEFSLWRENPNLPFLRDRILSFQGLLGSLVHWFRIKSLRMKRTIEFFEISRWLESGWKRKISFTLISRSVPINYIDVDVVFFGLVKKKRGKIAKKRAPDGIIFYRCQLKRPLPSYRAVKRWLLFEQRECSLYVHAISCLCA